MPVAIKGSGGGSVTLDSGAAAADTTLTLPNTSGTVVLTASPTFTGTTTFPGSTTVDSSGNVGIGTTSPTSNFQVSGANPRIRLTNTSGTTTTVLQGSDSGAAFIGTETNAPYYFITNNAERARIDSSGNLLVGTTTANVGIGDLTTVNGAGLNPSGFLGATRTSEAALYLTRKTSDGRIANFYRDAVGVGGISVTTTSTSFNTSSDYRLKYDVQPMTSGLATISALNPVTYKWTLNDTYGEGFIAHELQEKIPFAVEGEKNAVDANGKVQPQSVDYSKIVVHLVAAIQELSAENDALEAQLAALSAQIAALAGATP